MAKARTSRPTPAATEGRSELEFIADRLIEKVWQGNEDKRGLATQAASVALAAIQDHTAARYMETADKFDGRDMVNFWMNRELLREAHASVALDGETQSVEVQRTPTEWGRLKGIIVRDPDGWRGDKGRPWTDAITEREFDQRAAVSTTEPGNDVGRAWFKQPRFREDKRREEALERIVNEDAELLERLAEND